MGKNLDYLIDGEKFTVNVPAETEFFVGENICLSKERFVAWYKHRHRDSPEH